MSYQAELVVAEVAAVEIEMDLEIALVDDVVARMPWASVEAGSVAVRTVLATV